MKQLSQIYLLSLLIVALPGCTSIGYYTQAVNGQWSLLMARQPIDDLLADPATDELLKQALETAVAVREFAHSDLAMPANGSFRDYVALDRPYVVVNLVAVPEFSLQPHQWCYPFLGCQAYRGYFNPDDAKAEALQFKAKDYDTWVGGVTAYSTLGWFDDPLHSGFTRLPAQGMAALIIHELSHQIVYIPDDTAFNESFATAVELEGLRLWLLRHGQSDDFERALTRLDQRNQTLQLVQHAADKLEALYRRQGEIPDQTLRERKSILLDQLRADYLALSEGWSEPGPLGDNPPPLNNANLALFQQYNQFVPGFRQLLREHHYQFAAFYHAAITLSQAPSEQRHLELARLGKLFNEHL